MMSLTTRLALSLATLGFASILGASPAQAAPAGGKDRSHAKGERMCARLACSDAQKAQIKQIKSAGKTPQAKAARDNLRSLREQLHTEQRKPSPDPATIARLDAQMQAQKTALRAQHQARQQQILAVLNPEQKAKFLEFAAKRKDGKRGHGDKDGKRDGKRR